MKRTTDRPRGVVRFSPSEEVYIVCSYRLRSLRYRRDMYYDDDEIRSIKDEARRAVKSLRKRRGEASSSLSSDEEGDREDFTSMGIERLLMTRAEREEQKAGKKRTIRAVLEEQERQRATASFPNADAIAEVCSRESLPAREAALASGMGLADELLLEEAASEAAKAAERTAVCSNHPSLSDKSASSSRRRRRRRRSLSDGAIAARIIATERPSSPPRGNAGETTAGNVHSDAVVRVRSFSNPRLRASSPATRVTAPIATDDVEAKFAKVSVVDKHNGERKRERSLLDQIIPGC